MHKLILYAGKTVINNLNHFGFHFFMEDVIASEFGEILDEGVLFPHIALNYVVTIF